MPRLAVLGFGHETNTFSSVPADLASYQDGGIHRGDEMVRQYATSEATYAGFLAPTNTEDDVELVPLLAAWVNPCGAVTAEAFEAIVDEMVTSLRAEGPFDGVLLGLHGAAVAEGFPDADSTIAERVQDAVGPATPIGAVVDMHANLSPRLAETVRLLFAYQTNPHVDARLRGLECREALLDLLRSGSSPSVVIEQLPLVVTITKQDTREDPMRSILAAASDLEHADGVLDVSVLEGFPYADTPHMGMSVTVTHRDGTAAARRVATQMAEEVWARRESLQGGGQRLDAALDQVAGHRSQKPLLVLDVGDNVGGGGPGDSTVILAEAVRRQLPRIVTVILDPRAVANLADTPVGDRVDLTIGVDREQPVGPPVHLKGTLHAHSDGRYEEPLMAHGGLRYFDSGRTVVVRTDQGPIVVLTTKLVQPITPHQLYDVDLDPASLRAIVAKGVNGPRAGFADVCGRTITVDTPGVTRLSVEEFSYLHRRHPMYPFEPTTTYPAPTDRRTEG